MAGNELIRRNGLDGGVVRARRGVAGRLFDEAGAELLRSDLGRVIAENDVRNVEAFYREQVQADSRVAAEFERFVREHPNLGPVFATQRIEEYRRVTQRIPERWLIR